MATSSAVADLGKRLLEASRKGNAEEVRQLMANGAPITTDWVGFSLINILIRFIDHFVCVLYICLCLL